MEAVILVVFIWYAINTHRKIRILEQINSKLVTYQDYLKKRADCRCFYEDTK